MSAAARNLACAALLLSLMSQAWAGVTVSLTAPANGATVNPPVTLSATASATQGYTVSKVEFFDGSTLIGTDTTSPYTISWQHPAGGTHTLTAKATATKSGRPNQTATSSPRNVTVNAPPAVTITSPTEGATFNGPSVTVNVSASDSDGSIARVDIDWYDQDALDQGSMTLTQPPYTFNVTLNPLDLGVEYNIYTFSALAIDDRGGWTSNQVTVMVGPTVTLTSPGNGANFAAPATITLTAVTSPSEANLQKVEFYQGSTLIGVLDNVYSSPHTFVWQNVAAGTYSLTAKAIHIFGWVRTSPPVNVTVTGTTGATIYFIHTDHLNTPRLVADATGTTVWRWDQQEPFGVNVPDENPAGLGAFEFPLRFPGQYADKETNLHYNMARDFSPDIGRYIQSDPIGLAGGINTYVYVLDPLTQIDPEGLMGRAPGTFGKPGAPGSSTPAVPSVVPISCDGEWKQRGHDEQLPKTLRLCTCYWLCIPCDRPVIWSGNKRDLPSTGGQLFYDSIGGAVRTGNRCICTNKPGPEKSCKPCQQNGGAQ